jgi:hypothetical protein
MSSIYIYNDLDWSSDVWHDDFKEGSSSPTFQVEAVTVVGLIFKL